jgi:DNA-binding response OmpR family regulator
MFQVPPTARMLDQAINITLPCWLDLIMPGMNGEETFDAIRKIMNVPVVVLSAVHQKEEIIHLFTKGVDD